MSLLLKNTKHLQVYNLVSCLYVRHYYHAQAHVCVTPNVLKKQVYEAQELKADSRLHKADSESLPW